MTHMESHAELRAKKAQKTVTDDALLAAGIADQLWAVMVLTDVPGEGKGVVCTKVFARGLFVVSAREGMRGESLIRHVIYVYVQMLRERSRGGLAR